MQLTIAGLQHTVNKEKYIERASFVEIYGTQYSLGQFITH